MLKTDLSEEVQDLMFDFSRQVDKFMDEIDGDSDHALELCFAFITLSAWMFKNVREGMKANGVSNSDIDLFERDTMGSLQFIVDGIRGPELVKH